jgi:hypothetical protein
MFKFIMDYLGEKTSEWRLFLHGCQSPSLLAPDSESTASFQNPSTQHLPYSPSSCQYSITIHTGDINTPESSSVGHTPCCFSMLHVYPACPCYMSMLRVHAARPGCMFILLVHHTCPLYMSILYQCLMSMSPCCMSMLQHKNEQKLKMSIETDTYMETNTVTDMHTVTVLDTDKDMNMNIDMEMDTDTSHEHQNFVTLLSRQSFALHKTKYFFSQQFSRKS